MENGENWKTAILACKDLLPKLLVLLAILFPPAYSNIFSNLYAQPTIPIANQNMSHYFFLFLTPMKIMCAAKPEKF